MRKHARGKSYETELIRSVVRLHSVLPDPAWLVAAAGGENVMQAENPAFPALAGRLCQSQQQQLVSDRTASTRECIYDLSFGEVCLFWFGCPLTSDCRREEVKAATGECDICECVADSADKDSVQTFQSNTSSLSPKTSKAVIKFPAANLVCMEKWWNTWRRFKSTLISRRRRPNRCRAAQNPMVRTCNCSFLKNRQNTLTAYVCTCTVRWSRHSDSESCKAFNMNALWVYVLEREIGQNINIELSSVCAK